MKYIKLCFATAMLFAIASCGQTSQQDNTTKSNDTMVIKKDQTDSATKTVTTDTTKR